MNANSWQDLPQQPRWSKQRVRKLLLRLLGWTSLAFVILGGCLLCLKKAPAQPFQYLKFSTNGVIQEAWFTSHISLPWNENLITIDLKTLHDQILQYSQIQSVDITREYPSHLRIQLHERIPCAKMIVQIAKKRKLALISKEGFIFFPIGFSKHQLRDLKAITGISAKFINKQTILGFPVIDALFIFLQTRAPDLWQQIRHIDLKHFDPFVEKKWQTLDLLIHNTWMLTFPLENPEFALKKLQAILRALSRQQRQQLKHIDISLSHPLVEFQKD